jgi:glycosyltransferase involved in cell wall biosynthesis
VAQLNLRDAVQFIGHVQDVGPLLGAADVFVLPSLSEGSPNVLLEAMAARVPAIATSVGGIPEMVIDGESAFLVPPGNAIALCKAMVDRASAPARAMALAANAYERVRNLFTPEAYGRRILGTYYDLLKSGR